VAVTKQRKTADEIIFYVVKSSEGQRKSTSSSFNWCLTARFRARGNCRNGIGRHDISVNETYLVLKS
jgi:hypothetical protein